ncbi:MAG TPA: sugar ABC transporter ATP-binding protein, partial [Clostridia bacterium]|nr:sugar ABC transporter ATP-binding protein [Clostridia bacterium]
MQEMGAHPAGNGLVLEITGVTKIFPGIKALDDVRFDLRRGEIHALIGENGAGKSTFIKVLTGVHQQDSGTILLNGQPVRMTDPLVARRLGIAAIYQHLAAYPHLSVAENIFMGNEQLSGPLQFINWPGTRRRAAALLKSLGSGIDPAAKMGELSVAQQQIVEIAKALSQDASVLIMDEPTAALSQTESEELYAIVRGLKEKGTSVILISHRFEDVYSLADRVTVLRDGRYIGTWDIQEADSALLVNHMVGRSIDQFFPQKTAPIGEELLRVDKLGRTGFFSEVSFSLRAGEILGLTGLFYHLNRDVKNWWIILILFIMTGAAIVFYLNQYPNQPRERDYAYAGSFYFFTVWIGLGVLAIFEALSRLAGERIAAPLSGILCFLAVPLLMGCENWDDHDRSGRYLARDVAFNYLNSCAPGAILFTNGDNDTFPLWYAQEVEGKRTDVRVCNLMLLNTDWYIEQMKRRVYESGPLPVTLPVQKYYDGINNQVFIVERTKDPVSASTVIDYVTSDNKATKVQISPTETLDIIPSRIIRIPVDSAKVIASGTVRPEDAGKIVPYIDIRLKGNAILKSQLIVLDILA